MAVLEDVYAILFNRKQRNFFSICVKNMLNKKVNEGELFMALKIQ
jgi:hypothetical protein